MAFTEHIKLDELIGELQYLREENQALKIDNDFLQRQNNACKLRCSKFAIQVRELESEIADMKFTRKYLTSEEAGKRFAQELLNSRDSFLEAEIAAEKHEKQTVKAMGSYFGDDY